MPGTRLVKKLPIVESLARRAGNVTGFTNLQGELGGSGWSCSKKPFPRADHVAVLYDAANPDNVRDVKEALPVAARALGLTLRSWEVRAAEDFDGYSLRSVSGAQMGSM
jgi:hypothetical protein